MYAHQQVMSPRLILREDKTATAQDKKNSLKTATSKYYTVQTGPKNGDVEKKKDFPSRTTTSTAAVLLHDNCTKRIGVTVQHCTQPTRLPHPPRPTLYAAEDPVELKKVRVKHRSMTVRVAFLHMIRIIHTNRHICVLLHFSIRYVSYIHRYKHAYIRSKYI